MFEVCRRVCGARVHIAALVRCANETDQPVANGSTGTITIAVSIDMLVVHGQGRRRTHHLTHGPSHSVQKLYTDWQLHGIDDDTLNCKPYVSVCKRVQLEEANAALAGDGQLLCACINGLTLQARHAVESGRVRRCLHNYHQHTYIIRQNANVQNCTNRIRLSTLAAQICVLCSHLVIGAFIDRYRSRAVHTYTHWSQLKHTFYMYTLPTFCDHRSTHCPVYIPPSAPQLIDNCLYCCSFLGDRWRVFVCDFVRPVAKRCFECE